MLISQSSKDKQYADINVVQEVNKMMSRILLTCAFGVDLADEEVNYWVNGSLQKRTVGFSLSTTFHDLI